MTSLIIDTSQDKGCLITANHGVVQNIYLLSSGRQLSSELFQLLPSVLDDSIQFIALGIGPGTFTGTRIGGMAAKSIAYAKSLPLIPFSSLLLFDFDLIAKQTYEDFLKNEPQKQIDLVYISKTT